MARPKKIDTWKIEHNGEVVEVTIFIVKDHPGPLGIQTIFRAESDRHNIKIVNANINDLRKAVEQKVKDALSRPFGEFFYITFSGSGRENASILSDTYESGGSDRAALDIKIDKLWLTTDDGPRLRKGSESGNVSAFNGHIGEPRYSYDNPTALVPNTAENRAGLRRIFAGVEELNKRIKDLLDHDKIQTNLLIIGAPDGNLLTGKVGEE